MDQFFSISILVILKYLFLSFQVPVVTSFYVSKDYNGTGKRVKVDTSKCSNLPEELAAQVSSVHTGWRCAQLFAGENCNGDSIEITPTSPLHGDLGKWGFDNKTVSIRPCVPLCSSNYGVQVQDVQLFSENNFEGLNINIALNGCTIIPEPFNFNRSLKSIHTYGQCVQIYDNEDCEVGGRKQQLLELRPKTKFLDNLLQWNFVHFAKAITYCDYTCGGTRSDDRPPPPDSSFGLSTQIIIVIAVVPVVVVLIIVAVTIYVVRKMSPRNSLKLSTKEIQEFIAGLGLDIERGAAAADQAGGQYSVELIAQNQPYNQSVEVARSNLKFDSMVPLGMGEYGVVFRGTVKVERYNEEKMRSTFKGVPVAVKTVKPGASAQYLRALLKEVKVMLYVGKHDHIAQLIGCCTENLQNGEIFVLMEFCSNGNLEAFLMRNRHAYKDSNADDMNNPEDDDNISPENSMKSESLQHLVTEQAAVFFDYFQLIKWCVEIARGMEFLSSAKVVHSDLAARNILLCDNLQAKISDFGLSRQLYNYSQYVKKNQEPLPWRWMSIESLKYLQFSSESDVWSYGIFCWEIFTLGEKPYLSYTWSDDFVSCLENGLRPPKPNHASVECYNLMLQCWESNPKARPTFSQILGFLSPYTDTDG